MKALLLAAGLGSRLGKHTEKIPKCLIKIGGETMLDHWLLKLDRIGVTDFIINTHYLSEMVEKHISNHPLRKKIQLSYEPQLLGTFGTLLAHAKNLRSDNTFIVHVDNYFDSNLDEFFSAHQRRPDKTLLTMLTFTTETPETCGTIILDKKNRLINFFEKQPSSPSKIANGAVYCACSEFFDEILEVSVESGDISQDVIPKFINKIYCFHTEQYFEDIGCEEKLFKTLENFRK